MPARSSRVATPTRGHRSPPATARAIPGYSPEGSVVDNADAVSALVGAPVSPLSTFPVRTTVGERRVSVEGLALDGSVGLGDRLRLVSGRWPRGTAQALVTGYGISRGLPSSGSVTVSVDGTDHTFDLVGVAQTQSYYSGTKPSSCRCHPRAHRPEATAGSCGAAIR